MGGRPETPGLGTWISGLEWALWGLLTQLEGLDGPVAPLRALQQRKGPKA